VTRYFSCFLLVHSILQQPAIREQSLAFIRSLSYQHLVKPDTYLQQVWTLNNAPVTSQPFDSIPHRVSTRNIHPTALITTESPRDSSSIHLESRIPRIISQAPDHGRKNQEAGFNHSMQLPSKAPTYATSHTKIEHNHHLLLASSSLIERTSEVSYWINSGTDAETTSIIGRDFILKTEYHFYCLKEGRRSGSSQRRRCPGYTVILMCTCQSIISIPHQCCDYEYTNDHGILCVVLLAFVSILITV
jgi:hypothetical protein